MSCGLPVVGTGWGGNTEFMNDLNSYLLSYKMKLVSSEQIKHQPAYRGHQWADVDHNVLGNSMWHVYRNQEEAVKKGNIARDDMMNNWTWKMACEKLVKEIENLI